MHFVWVNTPATIKKQVPKFTKTTIVLIIATISASLESSLALSPNDKHHNLHNLLKVNVFAFFECFIPL